MSLGAFLGLSMSFWTFHAGRNINLTLVAFPSHCAVPRKLKQSFANSIVPIH